MTDQFDRAQALEALAREEALTAARAAAQPTGATFSHCADCGDEIPAARRAAAPGCTRCVACQSLHERGRYGR